MLHSVRFLGIWRLQRIHRVLYIIKEALLRTLGAAQPYIRVGGGGWVGGGSLFQLLGIVSKNNQSAPPPPWAAPIMIRRCVVVKCLLLCVQASCSPPGCLTRAAPQLPDPNH